MDWSVVAIAVTIPLLLRQGSIVISDLKKAVRAKKALEQEVFRLARNRPDARHALAAGVDDEARMAALTALVLESTASLDQADATVIRGVLDKNGRPGNADYVRDVARHVEARLSAQAA